MSSLSVRSALVAMITFTVLLTACGDDESASTTTTAPSTSTEAPSTTSTAEPDEDVPDDGDGEASGEFCAELETLFSMSGEGVFTQEQAEAADELAAIAPAEIASATEAVRDGITAVAEMNSSDPTRAAEMFTEMGPGSDYLTSVEELYTWVQTNCIPGG
jgi:hypothetical protein